jgi:hypothetical protein
MTTPAQLVEAIRKRRALREFDELAFREIVDSNIECPSTWDSDRDEALALLRQLTELRDACLACIPIWSEYDMSPDEFEQRTPVQARIMRAVAALQSAPVTECRRTPAAIGTCEGASNGRSFKAGKVT